MQLSESPYLAGVLAGVAGVPGYFLSPVLDRFGRRPVALVTAFGCGICMLLVLVNDDATLWLAVRLVAMLFATCAYTLMFIYTPEYLPTTVRTIGLGIATTWSRIGAMIAPYIVDLARDAGRATPSVIFGTSCLLAGVAVLFLPETAGRRLPETVAELEAGALAKPEDSSETKEKFQKGSKEAKRSKEAIVLNSPGIAVVGISYKAAAGVGEARHGSLA